MLVPRMPLRLKILKMTFIRYHQFFLLLTCSIFLYFISNQFFYQLVDTNPSNSNSKMINKSFYIEPNRTITISFNNNYNNNSISTIADGVGPNIESNNQNANFKMNSNLNDKTKTNALSVSKSTKYYTKQNVTVNVSFSKSIVTKIVQVKDKNKLLNDVHSINTTSAEKDKIISPVTPTLSTSTAKVSNESIVDTTTGRDLFQLFKDTASKWYQLFSPDSLSDYRKWAVEKERQLLQEEMKGYVFLQANKTLNDFVMEEGGQPIRNVIFTTWRSGSTFLGEILSNHPATFYHYEPLLHFGQVQVREGPLANEALRVIHSLLNCDYSNLTDYMTYGQLQHWVFNHNTRVWNFCIKNRKVCWDGNFHENMCKMFPFQALKTVRMRLKLARPLLENKKLNIKLLHLVRDPRGTIQSRLHRDWCPNHPDCDDPKILCSDLVQDFNEAKKLRIEYPDRFMVVRYEDISTNINAAIRKIFKFFRLPVHPKVKTFIYEHTKENVGGVSSTYRDSKTAPFHWLKDFSHRFSTIVDIQNSCKKALDVWGYNYVHSAKDLQNFKPLKNPPWTDMVIS